MNKLGYLWKKFARLRIFLFAALFLCAFSDFAAANVNAVRVGQGIGNVRIVLDSDNDFNYKVFTLNNPRRLVLDVYGTQTSKGFSDNIGRNNIISGARVGNIDGGKRFVFDLSKPIAVDKISFLAPHSGFKWRFFVDVSVTSERAFDGKVGDKYAYSNLSGNTIKKSSEPKAVALKETPKKSKKIIVIDPGHGGKDPGAIGYSGVYEKNITLAMGKELKETLESGGYKVYLTRSTDKFINLRERYQIARRYKADLFMSVHADSAKNRQATGLSVYTLSENASDREAAALAERENKADIIGGMNLAKEDKDLTSVFISLTQTMTRNNSSDFAELLQEEMAKSVKLVNNAHRFAGFAVLKAPDIPSVLLELGYLSNRNEEKLLKQASYRKKLAKSTLRAVDRYFAKPRE